jgi:hypothetical protein
LLGSIRDGVSIQRHRPPAAGQFDGSAIVNLCDLTGNIRELLVTMSSLWLI